MPIPSSGTDKNIPFGQERVALETRFHGLHGLLGEGNAFLVNRARERDDEVQPLLGHAPGSAKQGVHIGQQGAIPMLFEVAPAALHRVVLARVRRVVQELDGLADRGAEIDPALEELGTPATAFRTVVRLDLKWADGLAFLGRQVFPVRFQTINDEIAGLG